jgi:MFS family permease
MVAHLPTLILTPFSGFLADRLERRKLLAATYAVNLAITLLLALLVISGQVTEWYILVLATLNGCVRAVETPANQALLPNLIPRERLLNAVALNQLMNQGARMIGPLLILPIIRFIEPEPAFFLAAGLYALGWIQVLTMRTSSRGVVEARRGLSGIALNLAAGVQYIYTHPLILSVILLTVLHCALTMAYESVFPYFSRAQLGMTAEKDLFEGPTYLMIGLGAGAILGNLGMARIESQRLRGQLFLGLGILSGLTPIALGFTATVPQAMVAAAAIGATTAAFMTLSHGLVQSIVPDNIRGRVMGANSWHTQGTMAGFNAVNGVLMDISWMTGMVLLTGSGLIFLAVVIGSFLAVPLRAVYSRGMPIDTRGTEAHVH